MFQEGDCESALSSLMRYCLCTRAVQPLDLFWTPRIPKALSQSEFVLSPHSQSE